LTFFKGSCDGDLRLWKCGDGFKRIVPLFTIPVVGFVNAISFTPDGLNVIVGVGQEHRLGRWRRIKEAKNCIFVIPLVKKSEPVNTE
jgi:ribosomal RNA-processing protein 9